MTLIRTSPSFGAATQTYYIFMGSLAAYATAALHRIGCGYLASIKIFIIQDIQRYLNIYKCL